MCISLLFQKISGKISGNVWYDNGGIIHGGGIISFINYLYQKPLDDTSSALKISDGI